MSAYLMHSDPRVYPKPFVFIPERWLGEIDPAMHKSYVPFCRGSRNCLGMKYVHTGYPLNFLIFFAPFPR